VLRIFSIIIAFSIISFLFLSQEVSGLESVCEWKLQNESQIQVKKIEYLDDQKNFVNVRFLEDNWEEK